MANNKLVDINGLSRYHENLKTILDAKQGTISDLEDIRSGAAKGATALQEVPAEYVTETELAGMNYATVSQVNEKQDIISDLETIRSGAAKGATALQSVPAEYVTDTELASKGYATVSQVNEKQDIITDLETIRSGAAKGATALQEVPAEYVTETELAGMNYATTTYVNDKVAALVNGAPETLDTLDELAAALKDNADIVNVLTDSIGKKQDTITDLETIRSGAAKGATALQEVPAEYVTETELAGMNYATVSQVNEKQDIITDLETIRSGAAKGATALQSVPAEYVTETELTGKGYLTANDLAFATDSDIDGLFS